MPNSFEYIRKLCNTTVKLWVFCINHTYVISILSIDAMHGKHMLIHKITKRKTKRLIFILSWMKTVTWWRHQVETVNSPHKIHWRRASMFSLICVWINGWVNNREAGDLRCYRAHYDFIVMNITIVWQWHPVCIIEWRYIALYRWVTSRFIFPIISTNLSIVKAKALHFLAIFNELRYK